MKTCIEILPQHNLRNIYTRSEHGQMAQTFSCNIEWENGDIIKSYIKRFPSDKLLGILNEITGYIIAKGCDLPIAQHAGIIKGRCEQAGNFFLAGLLINFLRNMGRLFLPKHLEPVCLGHFVAIPGVISLFY